MIRQGDVLLIDFGVPAGSVAGYTRPAIVLQCDQLNDSRLATIFVVPLTSNLHFSEAPGNVRLRKGEANLSKPSVAQVCLATAVDRSKILEHIGRVGRQRLADVFNGLTAILEPQRD